LLASRRRYGIVAACSQQENLLSALFAAIGPPHHMEAALQRLLLMSEQSPSRLPSQMAGDLDRSVSAAS